MPRATATAQAMAPQPSARTTTGRSGGHSSSSAMTSGSPIIAMIASDHGALPISRKAMGASGSRPISSRRQASPSAISWRPQPSRLQVHARCRRRHHAGEHAEHIGARQHAAGDDDDGPDPVPFGQCRHQQQELGAEAAARRQAHQRQSADREGQHHERRLRAESAQIPDAVMAQHFGHQPRREEHAGLGEGMRHDLQPGAGPRRPRR